MEEVQEWLVVMTKPRMESIAKEHLIRQRFEVYLPLWVDLRRRPGGWRKVNSAMFPRYLFARPSLTAQRLSPIRSTRGVHQLVCFGTEPARAGDALIGEIRALEAARNAGGDDIAPFRKGDQVTVLGGPFKGVSAEVLSSDQQRVILLLEILGKTQKLAFRTALCRAG